MDRHMELTNKRYEDVLAFEERLQKEYNRQIADIETQINDFISKTAIEGNMSLDEAKKYLSPMDYDLFKLRIKNVQRRYRNIGGDNFAETINRLYKRENLTRLEAMKAEIELQMGAISIDQSTMTEEFLRDYYVSTSEDEMKLINERLGLSESPFNTPALETLAPIVQYPYTGEMFSERIWNNNQLLAKSLVDTLTLGMVQGKSIDKMSKMLKDKIYDSSGKKPSTFNVRRVVRTESAFIQERAKHDTNVKYGLDKYIIICACDERSCKLCNKKHDTPYPESMRTMGDNSPPFHPQCRCTTAPYIPDDELELFEQAFINKMQKRNNEVPFRNVEEQIKALPTNLPDEFIDGYLKDAKRKVEKAPKFVRQVWDKYEKDIAFYSIEQGQVSHYSPKWEAVALDMVKDARGKKTYLDTFFHELGHLFDIKGSGNNPRNCFSTRHKAFADSLNEEARLFIRKVAEEYDAEAYSEKQEAVMDWFMQKSIDYSPKAIPGASDMINGATKGQYSGGWGHRNDYWDDDRMLPKEAFAEMFSATMNNDFGQLQVIKEIFPKSYKEFEKICEMMVKNNG